MTPSEESPGETEVRDSFLRVYREDLATHGPRRLEEYLQLFPGHEKAIADEYRTLEPPSDDATNDQPAAATAEAHLESIGPYRILDELGRGGQAVVYLAEHRELHRRVALKVLHATVFDDGSGKRLTRFRREAEVAARLDHPDICCVFEAGESDGLAWIAMRYVQGETLAQKIADSRGKSAPSTRVVALPDSSGSGQAPPPTSSTKPGAPSGVPARGELFRAVALIERVARALHTAHEQGLIHRDIKPGNIMVTGDGNPVLLDFGMASDEDSQELSLTQPGDLMGTPYYMSPEQLLAKRIPLDRRTDIYSLGVTLYECVTLRRAFDAPTRGDLYQRIIAQASPDPRRINRDIPADLKVVIEAAIDRDRSRRYRTALDFAEDLRRIRAHEPIQARPIGSLLRSRRWMQRHPAITAVLAVVTVALAITSWLLLEVSAGLARSRALNLVAAAKDELSRDATLAMLLAREAVRLDPSHVSLFHQVLTARFPVAEVRYPALPKLDWIWCGFSRNGERLLEIRGGDDPSRAQAAVRDAEGTLIATIEPPAGILRAVDNQFGFLSADGQRVALREPGGVIGIWRVDDGSAVREADLVAAAGTDPVSGFRYHAGSDRLFVARESGAAALHDWQGRAQTLCAPGPRITSNPSFSVTGDRVAFGCEDGHVEVRAADGALLRRLATGTMAVRGTVASSSLDTLAARLADGSLVVWRVDDESRVSLQAPEPREYGDMAISPAGDRVLGFSLTGGDVWTSDGVHLAAIDGFVSIGETRDYWTAHAFAPDGEHFVTLSEGSSRIRIFDKNGQLVHVVRDNPWRTNSVRWLDEGRFLCSLGREVRMYDLDGMALSTFKSSSGFERLAFAADGHRFATAVNDGRLLIWDTERAELPTWTPGGVVMRLAISPDGTRIATALEKEGVALWTRAGEALARFGGTGLPVSGVAFSPDGRRLALSRLVHLQVFDTVSHQQVFVRNFDRRWKNFHSIRYSPDGRELLVAQHGGPALMWRVDEPEAPAVTFEHGELGHPYTEALASRGDRVVTTNWSGHGFELACWTSGGELLWRRRISASGRPSDTKFSPDGSLVLTALESGWVELRGSDGDDARGFDHPTSAKVVNFSPDGTRFVTAGEDDVVRIWTLDFELVATLTGHTERVTDAQFSHDGTRVLTSSRDGSVRTWYANNDELRRRAYAMPIRDFTAAERRRYAEMLDR